MAVKGKTGKATPVASPAVAALADLPAGPALAAALAAIDMVQLTGFESVLVLKAQTRQCNHERGRVFQAAVQVLRHRGPGKELLDGWQSGDLARSSDVRAALMLTRHAAKDLCIIARDLAVRLPAVLDAVVSGVLDEARARIFATWTADLTDRHATTLVARLLTVAPMMTTSELIAALQRGAIELDPEWARRRYERAVGERRLEGHLRTDGTADLIGRNLPTGSVAIACARIDRLVHRLHQAGYPGRLDALRADLMLDKLNGRFEGLTDDDIFDWLMFSLTPEYAEAAYGGTDTPAEAGTADSTVDDETGGDDGDEPDGATPPPDDPPPAQPDPAGDLAEPATGGGRRRSGELRLWVGLPTIVGLDRQPAELLGFGWIHAELATELAATPGASWWYAITDTTGAPLHVGAIRTRPTDPWQPAKDEARARIEVWLHLTRDELAALVHDPPPGWRDLITDLDHRIATSRGGPPNGDPTRRLPGDQLRRWLAIRDRRCTFPGCRVPAHRAHMDHTIEHTRGGPTLDANLAAACGADHPLRHEGGWTVDQPTPGTVVWTSPLGHDYRRLPEQTWTPMTVPITLDEDPDPEWYGVTEDPIYVPSDSCAYVIPPPEPRAAPRARPVRLPADDDDVPPF